MCKKLLSSLALRLAMLGAFAGANHHYGAFISNNSVPNWQRINNFNPKLIKHINYKRNSMKRRRY